MAAFLWDCAEGKQKLELRLDKSNPYSRHLDFAAQPEGLHKKDPPLSAPCANRTGKEWKVFSHLFYWF